MVEEETVEDLALKKSKKWLSNEGVVKKGRYVCYTFLGLCFIGILLHLLVVAYGFDRPLLMDIFGLSISFFAMGFFTLLACIKDLESRL